LETIGNSTSAPLSDEYAIDKFTLQAAARELSDHPALRSCLRTPVPHAQTVDILRRKGSGRVYFANLCTCKLVWLCPICAARISERRTQALMAALSETEDKPEHDWEGVQFTNRHLKYHVAMMTFTVGHKQNDTLKQTMKTLKGAYHDLFSGRAAQRFNVAYGLFGTVRAFEVTAGYANGWHPHIHTLIVSRGNLDQNLCDEMYRALSPRWVSEVESNHGYATIERGVSVVAGAETLIKYVDKAGQKIARTQIDKKIVYEETKTPAKLGHDGGRSLWQLLADYVRGDAQAGALWCEAQEQLRGTRQLLASQNIVGLLSDRKALSDEVAGEIRQFEGDILLAQLSLVDWRLVNRWGLRGRVLEAARQGDSGAVLSFIQRLRDMAESVPSIPT